MRINVRLVFLALLAIYGIISVFGLFFAFNFSSSNLKQEHSFIITEPQYSQKNNFSSNQDFFIENRQEDSLNSSIIISFVSGVEEFEDIDENKQPLLEVFDSSLQKVKKDDEYYCLKKKAIFSIEEYNYYWKYITYKNCKTASKDEIVVSGHKVNVKCANGNDPLFYYDRGEPELLENRYLYVNWMDQEKDIGISQFVLIKCSEKSIYTRVFFNYNKKAVDKAENIRKGISSASKPFTVALLVFDSVSMLSAQNNLPKSWNFLNNNQNVFKFDFAKSFSSTTRTNMIPVFYGMNLTYQETLVGGSNLKDKKILLNQKELQEKHAIWKHFSNLGFVTYFGYDSGFDFLAKSLGTEILTDHKFINFYKITNSVYKFNDLTANQRCAGDQGGHKSMLDHTLKYYSTYKGILKFGYTHISSAHEDTGNIRTVDEDLYEFLNDFFKLFSENKEDYVLFVMGDHGRMNNLLRFDNRGYLDVLNPMMFIAASQSVKDLFILKKNTERLIGRFDLHLTLKDLASFPYGGLTTEDYYEMKTLYSVKDVVSLFREEIKINRTCEDIGSDNQKCGCINFKTIDLNESINSIIVEEIIEFVSNHIFTNSENVIGCEKPIFHSLIDAKVLELKNFETKSESVFKISYFVQNKNSIYAEVYFWKEKIDKFWLIKKDKQLDDFLKSNKKPNKQIFINTHPATLLLWDFTISSPCQNSNCIC